MSSKGFDAVKTQNRKILKLYNSKKGTGGPKAAFGDVQYLNEVVRKAKGWTPEKAFAVGGVRVQSFSDYVPRLVFDYVQMIYDLAATKLPAHAYTKESLFVKQFALITVEQQNGKVQSVDFVDVAHAVSGRLVRDIEKENRSAQGTPPGTKSEWVTRFSTIKISDFLDIVNRTHQGYLSDDVISALNVERRGERKGLFSLRNEDVDNSPRGILMRLDVKSRRLDAEKYHLSRYQERVEKLAEQEARLKDANAKIEEMSSDKVKNKDAIRELQSEARNAQLQINMYNRQLRDAEKTDMFRKMVSDGRLLEYRAEQREAEKARIEEYRALRKELTGMDSVVTVMEDEFVRLAKDYEARTVWIWRCICSTD